MSRTPVEARAAAPLARRILIVATADSVPADLAGQLANGAAGRVHVISPMLHSPLRFYTNDDRARATAGARLETWVSTLRRLGIDVEGSVGDDDPVQSVEDGVALFSPEEVVLVTSPDEDAAWLERGAAEVARGRVRVPVRHLVAVAGGGSSVGAPADGDGNRESREFLILVVTGLLAMLGSAFWFLGGSVLPTGQLVLYAIVVDIIPKALFLYLLWRYRLGRGHDRGR